MLGEKTKSKGITLIALVITIIVMLILVGVTLTVALNGKIFSTAKEAVNRWKEAEVQEKDQIHDFEYMVAGWETSKTVTDAKKSGNPYKETTIITDDYGNPVMIPAGFKIASDSATNVQGGIVIEDVKYENTIGSQFVWIPISNIDGDNNDENNEGTEDGLITLEDGSKVEITLGRYTFDAEGNPTLMQKASNYADETGIELDVIYYELLDTEHSGVQLKTDFARAKDLKGFIESANINHGYYIARFEASNGGLVSSSDGKSYRVPLSIRSTSFETANKSDYGTVGKLFMHMGQKESSSLGKSMYLKNDYVESDLINSYMWDTAIVFIQKMGNINYSNQTRLTAERHNTGDVAVGDVKCNIFDMAGNLLEWTTESSEGEWNYKTVVYEDWSVARGGTWGGTVTKSITCVSDRSISIRGADSSMINLGFRVGLYIKY